LMLDLVAATSGKGAPAVTIGTPGGEGAGGAPGKYKSISAVIAELDAAMIDRFEAAGAWRRRSRNDATILCRLQTHQEFRLRRVPPDHRQDTDFRQGRSGRRSA